MIVSISPLDHSNSKEEISCSLKEFCRTLTRRSRLFLTLDNPSNPFIALRQALPEGVLRRAGIVPYYKGPLFKRSELCRTLDRVGFAVQEATTVLHSPRVIAVSLARIIESRGKESMHRRFLKFLYLFERLSILPSRRFITGHFLALCAKKKEGQKCD